MLLRATTYSLLISVFTLSLLVVAACSAPAPAPTPTQAPAAPAPTKAPAATPAAPAPTQAGESATAAPAPTAAQAAAYDPTTVKANLQGAGGTVGGIGYVVMTAMSKVVKDTYPSIDISVVPGGWVGNLPRVDSGELDIASTVVSMAGLAEQKLSPFEKEMPKLRSLFLTQDDNFYFAIVRKDFPAETVGEIVKNKIPAKLCTLAKGNATELAWRQAFEMQGSGWEQIEQQGGKMNFVAWADAVNLVKDGHADGILAVGAKQIGWAQELATAREIKILKWEPELAEQIRKNLGMTEGVIPANTYPGVDYEVDAPRDTGQIIISADVKPEVAYAIVKAVAEGEKEYAASHAAISEFKAAGMADGLLLPVHPGAEAYYKEKGLLK
ncbi:MAG: TAXI family TRAP transporter solute-binding subunit [Chloroflexota bacterium]|jgi:TRAP transporter TAXI family solute receptor